MIELEKSYKNTRISILKQEYASLTWKLKNIEEKLSNLEDE